MSGFAFQKLNGGQTTANKQLEALNSANTLLEEIEDNLLFVAGKIEKLENSIDKPEIWKMARMYAPNKELIPLQFTWRAFVGNENKQKFATGKMYFGELQICLRVSNLDANTGRHGAELSIFNNGVYQAEYYAMYKGDNGIDISTEVYTYRGFFTDLILTKHHSYDFRGECTVEFKGFELGEKTTNIQHQFEVIKLAQASRQMTVNEKNIVNDGTNTVDQSSNYIVESNKFFVIESDDEGYEYAEINDNTNMYTYQSAILEKIYQCDFSKVTVKNTNVIGAYMAYDPFNDDLFGVENATEPLTNTFAPLDYIQPIKIESYENNLIVNVNGEYYGTIAPNDNITIYLNDGDQIEITE